MAAVAARAVGKVCLVSWCPYFGFLVIADELHQLVSRSDLLLANMAAILTVDILFTKLAARLIKTICLRAAGRRLHSGGPVLQVLYVRVSAHAKRNQ